MPLTACVPPPARALLRDDVHRRLRDAIVDGTLAPGERLRDQELAAWLGVSRTPVREALLRLEVEGLIKLYPKKGALVLPVSAQEIADVVETRQLVEEHAARKALPASPQLIARLEELLAQQKEQAAAGDLAGAAVTDRCFHAEIVRSGGNEILNRLYDQLRDRQLRMGVAVMHAHPDRITKTLVEHEQILTALRSGDADAVVGLIHGHVEWFSHLARGEVR
jgi:DNA-binding GntR family transcriptional regulator